MLFFFSFKMYRYDGSLEALLWISVRTMNCNLRRHLITWRIWQFSFSLAQYHPLHLKGKYDSGKVDLWRKKTVHSSVGYVHSTLFPNSYPYWAQYLFNSKHMDDDSHGISIIRGPGSFLKNSRFLGAGITTFLPSKNDWHGRFGQD